MYICRKNIDLASYSKKKLIEKWPSFGKVLGGESKVSKGAKPCITHDIVNASF